MNTLTWILQIILAVVFGGAGLTILVKSRADLSKMFGGWVENVPPPLLKLLGLAEVAAAVGLILPPLVGVLPLLTAFAAIGVVIIMIGGVVIHVRLPDYPGLAMNVAIVAMAGMVVWARFGPYKF